MWHSYSSIKNMTTPSKEAIAAGHDICLHCAGRSAPNQFQVEEIIDRHFKPVRDEATGAAVMRKAIEQDLACSCHDRRFASCGCQQGLESSIATTAGRELLAELTELRSNGVRNAEQVKMFAKVADNEKAGRLAAEAEVTMLKFQKETAERTVGILLHDLEAQKSILAEVERLRGEVNDCRQVITTYADEVDSYESALDTLRRKVAAAEGMAECLNNLSSQHLPIQTRPSAGIGAALAAWKEAN